MRSEDTISPAPNTHTKVRAGAEKAVALLDAGIAENKAQLAKRFLDLARLLSSDELPTPEDWRLAKAAIALTMGILAREEQQVADMLKSREDEMDDWLLDTLRPRKCPCSKKRTSRRRTRRSR